MPLDSGFRRNTETGFTLVELLVALFIFGLLAATGVVLLSFSVRAEDNAATRMEEVSRMRRLGTLLTGDLAQAMRRVSRDENAALRPAFAGSASGGPLLAFVRAGWDNPEGAPRASLQKVEYRLSGNRLERVAYPHVDGAAPLPPMVLAEDVRSVRLRFRDENGAWLDRWIVDNAYAMPRVVELEIVTGREGVVRQLFLVGGA
ncbi:type II secretion system minor pseudopilin GspJ [Allosphingosinicella flava]|uniref:type II secretion system minor pseudopilin GspJ n=1 Tax=Allosphingosinicella flava TaxID=2771430 RepID=UPI001CF76FD3|nr:type II secretion system minor pseudopilin GspJ [Sphingosinicella flava]